MHVRLASNEISNNYAQATLRVPSLCPHRAGATPLLAAGSLCTRALRLRRPNLTDARRMWRYHTRDKSGSVSDIAANGLDPGKDHQLGAKLPRVTIVDPEGLELAEMTEAASKSILEWNR